MSLNGRPGSQPIPLDANQPATFYRGAGRIARFRAGRRSGPSGAAADLGRPEDWIASTTARFGSETDATGPAPGRSVLPGGQTLAAAIAADPQAWLGPAHVTRYGADPTILVKLLDSGQRLPVHAHPGRDFARTHLASPVGKTEAWMIVEAAPDAVVHLGFRRDVAASELAGWVAEQDVAGLLDATNRVPVRAGDTVLVPAGLPHAIGPGILLVEVQEASDLSVLLEWSGFAPDPATAFLGLPLDEALACVDRTGWGADRLAALRGDPLYGDVPNSDGPRGDVPNGDGPRGDRAGGRRGSLLPPEADGYFLAELLRPDPVSVLDAGFSVLVVTSGRGALASGHGPVLTVARGDTIVVPYAAGALTLRGDVSAVRARPVPAS